MRNINTKKFEYDDFLKLTKQTNQQKSAYQQIQKSSSQQNLLRQYKCMIERHKDLLIDQLCLNETCKAQNRRICLECLLEGIHERCHYMPQIKSADQSENIIQEFKFLLNSQMDTCQFQFSFEQLEFCDEIDDTLAYIKFKELIKIQEGIKSIQQQLDKLNFKLYLEQQYQKNLGLFQYLQDYQILVNKIYSQLNEYTQMKNQIRKYPEKFFQQVFYFYFHFLALNKPKQLRRNANNQKKKNIHYKYNFEDKSIQRQQIMATYYKLLFQLDATYYVNQGLHLNGNKKYAQAIIMFDQGINLDPKDEWHYYYKAQTLEKMGQYEQAILAYDQAIQLDPKDGWHYYYKAQTLEKMGQYEQAILVYDQAIQLFPKEGQYYHNKALIIKKLKKYEDTILAYDQAIQVDPKNGWQCI